MYIYIRVAVPQGEGSTLQGVCALVLVWQNQSFGLPWLVEDDLVREMRRTRSESRASR
jgi:hypothetical protein